MSLTVPSISFSLSLSVSLSAWAVSSSSVTLTCSVTLDLLGEEEGGQRWCRRERAGSRRKKESGVRMPSRIMQDW